jgi:hypothetical protein
MVVLDADSVMSGDCLTSMVKLMEANPTAGIIQTATQAIGHVTLHARAQQFASRVTGRLFTLGMQFWQLGESHYWGHNAIIRVEPFMKHCALAPIKGTGGMSGGIMSHDFVEAALMRRAGYNVWLVSDLVGSYEQQPPDLLAELQRDRRWCQGNLQNARLMAEPGIHPVHRAMFVTGTMAYVSAPLWLAFLTLGTALWLSGSSLVSSWNVLPAELAGLWAWTLCLLFLPRVLGIAAVLMRGEQRQYGGVWGLVKSSVLESGLAIVQAPVRMLAHSLFVVVALTGIKLDWKSPPREAAAVPWKIAATQLAPMTPGDRHAGRRRRHDRPERADLAHARRPAAAAGDSADRADQPDRAGHHAARPRLPADSRGIALAGRAAPRLDARAAPGAPGTGNRLMRPFAARQLGHQSAVYMKTSPGFALAASAASCSALLLPLNFDARLLTLTPAGPRFWMT